MQTRLLSLLTPLRGQAPVMARDFDFIPGFRVALQGSPDARNARHQLAALLSSGRLTARARAMIALTVAQESGLDYCIWAQTCLGRSEGLSGEEIVLACAGTALDRRDAARTRLAREIARYGTFLESEIRAMPQDPVLTRREMLEVATCASAALIDNNILQSLAPTGTRAAEPGQQ